MIYDKLGLSFLHEYGGTSTIIVVKARPPFRARTNKGIILGYHSLVDVEKEYGPAEVFGTDVAPEVGVSYSKLGISFYVDRIAGAPEFPVDNHLVRYKPVLEITTSRPN